MLLVRVKYLTRNMTKKPSLTLSYRVEGTPMCGILLKSYSIKSVLCNDCYGMAPPPVMENSIKYFF